MSPKQRLLMIFYRNPELGKVKTRLAASIGDDKALAVYLDLAAHTRQITEAARSDKVVFYSDYIDTEDNWNSEPFQKELQKGDDLGSRMENAFNWAFQSGYHSACIIGTDCFDLTAQLIDQAFTALEVFDVVIGPARDGGYYLLGMNKLHANFFKQKDWGTHTVYSDTLEDIGNLDLQFSLLPILTDVDEKSDLPRRYKI